MLFVSYIIATSKPAVLVTRWEVVAAFLDLILSAVIGFCFKAVAESVK